MNGKEVKKEVATLAGGCFWCLEAIFNELRGVQKVISGYSGGSRNDPSYKEISSGKTGHAEVIQITFDPKEISYGDILNIFFTMHDPTTLNRQGSDVGSQYRSAIFFHDLKQKEEAVAIRKKFEEEKIWGQPIVTEITDFNNFYEAEGYHQHYYEKNESQPYCQAIIAPKLVKLKKEFVDRLKDRTT